MVTMQKPRLALAQVSRIKPGTVAATRRTRGSAWMAIRARVLARDCGLCQPCRAIGRVTLGPEVDHVQELADGGTDADANLQAICAECHKRKTEGAQQERMGRS